MEDTRQNPQDLTVKFGQAYELPAKCSIGVSNRQANLDRAFDHEPFVVLAIVRMPGCGDPGIGICDVDVARHLAKEVAVASSAIIVVAARDVPQLGEAL